MQTPAPGTPEVPPTIPASEKPIDQAGVDGVIAATQPSTTDAYVAPAAPGITAPPAPVHQNAVDAFRAATAPGPGTSAYVNPTAPGVTAPPAPAAKPRAATVPPAKISIFAGAEKPAPKIIPTPVPKKEVIAPEVQTKTWGEWFKEAGAWIKHKASQLKHKASQIKEPGRGFKKPETTDAVTTTDTTPPATATPNPTITPAPAKDTKPWAERLSDWADRHSHIAFSIFAGIIALGGIVIGRMSVSDSNSTPDPKAIAAEIQKAEARGRAEGVRKELDYATEQLPAIVQEVVNTAADEAVAARPQKASKISATAIKTNVEEYLNQTGPKGFEDRLREPSIRGGRQ